MATLSTLLGQDVFPTLETLKITHNVGIGDSGIANLTLGLLVASRTLTLFPLQEVGMGDGGLEAIAPGDLNVWRS